jgi:predicted DNA-binding transcriptional regulator YafY
VTEPGTRSGRLLSIILLLQNRGSATARDIARHLGVSLRTVYRDMDVLSRTGVPIYAETGRFGGYRLVDGYRTTITGLTAHESLALFLIGMPAPAALLGLIDQARTAEAKLLAALSPSHREQASRLRDRFLLDLPAWYQDADTPPALPTLADAVLADQQVRVRYRRWKEPREVHRLLDPYGLVVKNGAWYLVAADGARRGHPRTYRVSNILALEPACSTFARPPDFDLSTFWREHLADFDRLRFTDTATVRISPALTARLSDQADTALQAAAAAGHVDDVGWTIAELPIESPGWAATHLIRYGGDIEVLGPPEARDKMHALAAAVLNHYEAVNRRRRSPTPSRARLRGRRLAERNRRR